MYSEHFSIVSMIKGTELIIVLLETVYYCTIKYCDNMFSLLTT